MTNEIDDLVVDASPSKALIKSSDWYAHLKPRQRRFIKRYAEIKERAQAWMDTHRACKDKASAHAAVSRFLKEHPQVLEFFYQAAGIGDDDIIKVVREGMDAKRQNIYRGQVHEFADPYARLKAAEMAMKVRGLDKPEIQNQTNVVILADPNKGIYKVIEGEEIPDNPE